MTQFASFGEVALRFVVSKCAVGLLWSSYDLKVEVAVIESIHDIEIGKGTALAVFTRGIYLTMYPDKTGSSGNWKVNPARHFDHFVIYVRDEDEKGSVTNTIYLGEPTRISASPERGRSIIHFRNLRLVGTTIRNWKEFADAGTNPVRYIRPR